nr:hypothetical protein [Tanacetum cinerariifolium]
LFEGMLAAREVEEEGIVEEQVQANDIVAAAVQETVAEDVTEDVANEAIPSTPTPLILPSPPSHDIPSTTQAEIYHLDLDHSSKVLSMQEDDSEVQEEVEVVTTAKLITKVVTAATSQVSAASATFSAAKPSIPAVAPTVDAAYTRRRKRVIIRDPEEELSSKTLADTPKLKDNGKVMKKRPHTESEARKNMMIYLKNTAGYKLVFFKGMSYDEICLIFQARFDANMRFLFKSREEMEEEDREVLKSINETPAQKAAKRRKLNEEA